jgi:NAD(P)-dependent dehydrogenase (short-subunit alcohol dehydrogenase family)
VHYAAAKAGVDALTVGLAKELADDGIRVNAVAPGTVRTGIHADAGDPGSPDRVSEPRSLPTPDHPEAAPAAVVAMRRLAGRLQRDAVVEAVTQDWTWAQVGEAVGISVIAAKKAAARTAAERTDGAARPTSATTSTHAAG